MKGYFLSFSQPNNTENKIMKTKHLFTGVIGMLSVIGSLTFLMNVFADNNAPNASNLSAAEAYTEDIPLNLIDIVTSDTDGGSLTATLMLSNSSAGTLNIATSGTVTSTYNAGTGLWMASGEIADVNILLAGVTFTPSANFNSNFSITTSVSDGIDGVNGSKTVTGTAVNDAPVLDASRSPALNTLNEDPGAPVGLMGSTVSNIVDSVIPAGGLDNITDVDGIGMPGAAVTSVDAVNMTCYYTLNSGTTWAAMGSVSNSSARLLASTPTNRIYCEPGANLNGNFPAVLTFRAWDQSSGTDGSLANISATGGTTAFSTSTDTVGMMVTAVNDSPAATNLNTSESYAENVPLNLINIVASDVDSANLTATLTLSDAATGSLSTGTSGAVTSTYIAGTGVWTASGATANVNILLAGVIFTPTLDFNGDFSIATSVSDGINSVTGTKTVTHGAVDSSPIAADDIYQLNEDSETSPLSVLENDTGGLNAITLLSVTLPDHGGTASIDGNDIDYTPAAHFYGTETFSYTIVATNELTDSAQVTVSVAQVLSNDATLTTTSTIKGELLTDLGTPNTDPAELTAGTITISSAEASDTSNDGSFITSFVSTNEAAMVEKIVKYSEGESDSDFGTDTAYDGSSPITDGDYFLIKVVAEDGSTVLYYKINVTVLSSSKAMTSFIFNNSTHTSISEESHLVVVTVPFGTSVVEIIPAISISGVSVNPLSGVAQDFTHPIQYTVTAEDETTQEYTVVVVISEKTEQTNNGGGGSLSTISIPSSYHPSAPNMTDTSATASPSTSKASCNYGAITGNIISRLELVNILVQCHYPNLQPVTERPFSDVSTDVWYAPVLAKAKSLGWISGYKDGRFKPFKRISRAEALKIILLSTFSDETIKEAVPSFSNTPNHESKKNPWYYKYIAFALKKNLLNPEDMPNNHFDPNDFFTGEQTVKIIQKLQG